METALITRGDPSLYTAGTLAPKIQRHEVGGLPVRSLPVQTRDGFISKQVLGSITSGKGKSRPIKLESAFKGAPKAETSPKNGPTKLESGSAKHLAVKSAAHLKK